MHEVFITNVGTPETKKRILVPLDSDSVENVDIYSARRIVLLGRRSESDTVAAAVVNVDSSAIEFNRSCRNLRKMGQGRYLWCTPLEAERSYVVDLLTGRLSRVLPAVEGAVAALASPRLTQRQRALDAIRSTPSMLADKRVIDALVAALEAAVRHDAAAAAAANRRVRIGTPERDYLGSLLPIVARTRDPRALNAAVRADHIAAAGSLAEFGSTVIPAVLDRLRAPDPAGYSDLFRAGLIEALRLIHERSRVDAAWREAVTEETLVLLEQPKNWHALVETLLLAEELDDDRFGSHIEELASSEAAIKNRGITQAEGVRAVRDTAQGILKRRVVIRDDGPFRAI